MLACTGCQWQPLQISTHPAVNSRNCVPDASLRTNVCLGIAMLLPACIMSCPWYHIMLQASSMHSSDSSQVSAQNLQCPCRLTSHRVKRSARFGRPVWMPESCAPAICSNYHECQVAVVFKYGASRDVQHLLNQGDCLTACADKRGLTVASLAAARPRSRQD